MISFSRNIVSISCYRLLIFKVICFHDVDVGLLFGNTLVGAIVLFCHVRDEVKAVRLHLHTRADYVVVLPCVLCMIRGYRT